MSKTEFNRIITRREFLRRSAMILPVASAGKSLIASGKDKLSRNTDYSPVIEKIKKMLPIAMEQKGITGASIAIVDAENIVWSEGFGYTDHSRKVKVTAT